MRKFALILAIALLFPISSIFAQSVDLLWQANTYTPPFYKGRALWSKQSGITLVAVPHGLGSASSLDYRWSQGGDVVGLVSGIGKNTLSYTDSILSKPQMFTVEIMSGETVRTSASVTVTPVKPSLLVYENNPLYGYLFHKQISDKYPMGGREVTFAAFPLFFSANDRITGEVGYEWRNNAGGVENANAVVYRTPDNSSGVAEVSIHTTNPSRIAQDVMKSFLIEFDNTVNNL